MKKGIKRFDFYLNQLENLLIEASAQADAGLWLYGNNVRTTLFMLEGLSKIYSGLHDKTIFSKINANFKLLEDLLGAVDYYDAFAKEFSANKKIPASITKYCQEKYVESS
jgi:hypothetical protein